MPREERTEKATPKHRKRAREKGQVARSPDLGGSVVVAAGLFALSLMGPRIVDAGASMFRLAFGADRQPGACHERRRARRPAALGASPPSASRSRPSPERACSRGVLAGVAQVGFRPSPHALKPDFRRINPASGLKNLLGPNAVFEAIKTVVKVAVVGAVAALALLPGLTGLAAIVGISAARARRARRGQGLRRRRARSLRLPADRAGRLRVEAPPPREAAEDDQAGSQGRDPPVRGLRRGQGRAAPPPDAGGARAHDGRRSRRRRGRHQPHALRRRALLRRHAHRPRGGRQGQGPDRRADQAHRRRTRRARDRRPAARARAARLGRDRPGDPGGALRGGRARARVRLPARRARGPVAPPVRRHRPARAQPRRLAS